MNKQDEALRVAEEVLADIELKRLKASEIVLKASRLARLVGHDELGEFLACERNGYSGSERKWVKISGRRLPGDENKYCPQPIAVVEAELLASQAAIGAMKGGGNYSGDYIAIAAREHDKMIGSHAQAVSTWSGIAGQVVAVTYDMVAEIYHELLFSELQATLFADTQARVDGTLARVSGAALDKIDRVSDRLRDGDPESVSQALTTCRRLIDSCADHLFPAQPEPYLVNEGVPLAMGRQNVLNRLQAHVHRCGVPKGRRDRLRRTLADLYDRCSAGTHSDVTVSEA
ncbi:hypothetical protein [Pseudoclavibacter helvolus]|uniref:AbiTii domain-containing protein n=1 Tax=Pseudoclavibacter helvolus TaxID=255205 RepID=UPI001428A622|nr:hypothetical protein [Pseudoclavibacter helvolus]